VAKKMSALVLLLIGSCTLLPNIDASLEATVYVKSDAADIRALKNVAGVSAVYKIKPLAWWSVDKKGQELNQLFTHVVVGKGLKDAAAQNKLISDVATLDFVQTSVGYRLNVDERFGVAKLNEWIKKANPKFFVKRPMKAASPKPPCLRMDLKEGQTLKVMTIARRGDMRMMEKMGRELLMRIFPALKASYTFIGQVDASHKSVWNDFTIMDYIDNDAWCEYAQSQYGKDFPRKFPNVFKGMGVALAVEE